MECVQIEAYSVPMHCPLSHVKENVYFYEVNIDGTMYLRFNGCNNSWHDCEECESCRKRAYEKMIKGEK